jgi:transposase
VQPHRLERFKLSNDPCIEETGYRGPLFESARTPLVLGVDEKSHIQALDRTAPILPLRPGLQERQKRDYKRHGTTTLFAAFNIVNGKVIGTCQERQRSREFVRFLNHLEAQLPADQEVHLITDNYCTHKSAEVQRWLKPNKRRRFHFHFTPTSSSWLNQVERFFALITGRMIRRGTFHSTEELEKAIYLWLATWSGEPTPFIWKASADTCASAPNGPAQMVSNRQLGTRQGHKTANGINSLFHCAQPREAEVASRGPL